MSVGVLRLRGGLDYSSHLQSGDLSSCDDHTEVGNASSSLCEILIKEVLESATKPVAVPEDINLDDFLRNDYIPSIDDDRRTHSLCYQDNHVPKEILTSMTQFQVTSVNIILLKPSF